MAFTINDGDVITIGLHQQIRVDCTDMGAGNLSAVSSNPPGLPAAPLAVVVEPGASPAELIFRATRSGASDIAITVDKDPDEGLSSVVKRVRVKVGVFLGSIGLEVRILPDGEWREVSGFSGEVHLPKNRTAALGPRWVPPVDYPHTFRELSAVTFQSGNDTQVTVDIGGILTPVGSIGFGPVPISISADVDAGPGAVTGGATVQVYISDNIAGAGTIEGEIETQP